MVNYAHRSDFVFAHALRWRHNEWDGVSNHQPYDCLLNCLSGRRSKKTSKPASLAFVLGIHRRPVNSPHKWPVTRKLFPFDDVIMNIWWSWCYIMDLNPINAALFLAQKKYSRALHAPSHCLSSTISRFVPHENASGWFESKYQCLLRGNPFENVIYKMVAILSRTQFAIQHNIIHVNKTTIYTKHDDVFK